MLGKSFQHRDINIGKVLLYETSQIRDSGSEALDTLLLSPNVSDDRKQEFDKTRVLPKRLRTNDRCEGFIVDGDLAIDLEVCFSKSNPYDAVSRSGTAEFMSYRLLDHAMKNRLYLQSPIDEFFSLFFVSLWAAIYHRDDEFILNIPSDLQEFRKDIAGGHKSRNSVVKLIIDPEPLDACDYGPFLIDCHPFLAQWEPKLHAICTDWNTSMRRNCDIDMLAERFCSFYERGFIEYMEVLGEKCPVETNET